RSGRHAHRPAPAGVPRRGHLGPAGTGDRGTGAAAARRGRPAQRPVPGGRPGGAGMTLAPARTRFTLPPELSAGEPPEARGLRRDQVRLLVADATAMWHARFHDIGRFLSPGDLLVVNTSATVPAAVDAGEVVVHFATPLKD